MSINVSNRLQKLRRKLAAKELDGILISQPENRYYLSDFLGTAGYLLITESHAVLTTDFRYTQQASIQSPGFRIFQITGSSFDWLVHLTSELQIKRLGFEAGDVTVARQHLMSEALEKAAYKIGFFPVEGVVESLRMVKEPGEIKLISRAAEISDKAMEFARKIIRVGITETGMAWEIEKLMRENGSQNLPFEVIVASGPDSALPHHRPSGRRICPGDPVVIDIGARVGGYCSDLTRTLRAEGPAQYDTQFSQVYDAVLKAQSAAISKIHEGISGADADSIARKVIEDAGYGRHFGHSLGHGVGLAEHEDPRLSPVSTDTLKPGMVFTIEPGIYLTGWGGVRIEDLAVLENDRIRLLSKATK